MRRRFVPFILALAPLALLALLPLRPASPPRDSHAATASAAELLPRAQAGKVRPPAFFSLLPRKLLP